MIAVVIPGTSALSTPDPSALAVALVVAFVVVALAIWLLSFAGPHR